MQKNVGGRLRDAAELELMRFGILFGAYGKREGEIKGFTKFSSWDNG